MSGSVTAVILAGGLGTRLRSAVSDRPKVMAPVAGRPFIEHLFHQVQQFGIKNVVLCVGYLAEMIQEQYGDSYNELSLNYSVERSLLGTGGALRFAIDQVCTENVLVLNGDSFCEFDYDAFLSFHESAGKDASMLLARSEDCSRYGAVQLDDTNRVSSFIEKSVHRGAGLINAGVYLLRPRLVKVIPPGRILSLEKDVFPQWVTEGRLHGFQTEGTRFIDIGTPQSFSIAQSLFTEGRP